MMYGCCSAGRSCEQEPTCAGDPRPTIAAASSMVGPAPLRRCDSSGACWSSRPEELRLTPASTGADSTAMLPGWYHPCGTAYLT